MRTPLYVVFGLALALAAPASAQDGGDDTVLKLMTDFQADEAAAVAAYEGRDLFIANAVIERVLETSPDSYLVLLDVPPADRDKVPPGAKGIRCVVSTKNIEMALPLLKGYTPGAIRYFNAMFLGPSDDSIYFECVDAEAAAG
jgi:hypothetical protein